MSGKPNDLRKFWQELKRRRVIHVIIVYASAAFVIIELIGNLSEPLNLPASLLTIAIVVLAVGFPFAIILSWRYALTSGGIEKTKPLSEIHAGKKTVISRAWKIATYVSFTVIIGLVVLNVMGTRNRIRPGDIQYLVILPFQNYTGDDQLDYFVSGLHASLIQDMGRASDLRVISKATSDIYDDSLSASTITSELNVDVVMEIESGVSW